ncbi:HesA/MoeB/ThiF family protein [Candidatus Woesearchaeota archaeon]|nr:HesA/MoeB/ThiF family protein [Candidatus Woesearchaeota archaeon]
MRYIRQEIFPKIGKENQEKLKNSTITIVGIGALGTTVLDILARAGIGNIRIIDFDIIELNNLQRQSLFSEEDINKPKAQVAKEKISKINSEIKIEDFLEELNQTNINILKSPDIILDCTDNMQIRFLINDFCKKNNTPWIYASVIEEKGMTANITSETPCLSCILNEPTENLAKCENSGILNTIVHSIAAIQATEAIKILTNQGYSKDLISYNIWSQELTKIKTKKREGCKPCNKIFEFLNGKRIKNNQKSSEYMQVRKCKTKGALEVIPEKSIQLKLNKLKDNYEIISELPILAILKINSYQTTVYKNGKILVRDCSSEEEVKKIAEKIYEDAK